MGALSPFDAELILSLSTNLFIHYHDHVKPSPIQQIDYSEKYQDGKFEYRHVILAKEMSKNLPKNRTLTESEWRGIGVQQSRGWEHYACHRPEPHILLFRRPLGTVRPSLSSSIHLDNACVPLSIHFSNVSVAFVCLFVYLFICLT